MTDESPADLSVETYQKAFDAALGNLEQLQGERDQLQTQIEGLDSRIEKMRQGAMGLAALIDIDFSRLTQEHPRLFADHQDPRLGITDAVREALIESKDVLSPVEIRDRVLRLSPAVAGHKNPMASIHAVLRRFVDSGDVVMADYIETGRTVYGWVGHADKLSIKVRLAQWFSNWEYVFNQNEANWRDREEGDDPHLQVLLTSLTNEWRERERLMGLAPALPVLAKRKRSGKKKASKPTMKRSLT